jgi:Tol biopolymer transport system component
MLDSPHLLLVVLAASAATGCFAPEHAKPANSTTSGASSTGSSSSDGPVATSDGTSIAGDNTSTAQGSSTAEDTSESSPSSEGTTGGSVDCIGSEAPFIPPVRAMGVNTDSAEDRAWLSPDELTIYLSSNRPGGIGLYDIYFGTRRRRDEPFGELTVVAEVSGVGDERYPALTSDGLSLYFTDQTGTGEIYLARRDSPATVFGAPAVVASINSPAFDGQPWISGDGDTIYFNSESAGTPDIYRALRLPDGSFGTPAEAAELNTGADELAPVLSSDGLTIFFQSDRAEGLGGYDIWMAERSTTDDGFGEPSNVTELNSGLHEAPSWFSEDQCRLYMRTRTDDTPQYDIWISTRED